MHSSIKFGAAQCNHSETFPIGVLLVQLRSDPNRSLAEAWPKPRQTPAKALPKLRQRFILPKFDVSHQTLFIA